MNNNHDHNDDYDLRLLHQRYPFNYTQIKFLLNLKRNLDATCTCTGNIISQIICKTPESITSIISNSITAEISSNKYSDHDSLMELQKNIPDLESLRWVDTFLLSPYYYNDESLQSQSSSHSSSSSSSLSALFLHDLIQCALQHSHVFIQNYISDENSNSTRRTTTSTQHLFLEALSGLSGRKGGPIFEIQVLFDFMLLTCQRQKRFDSDNDNHNDGEDDAANNDTNSSNDHGTNKMINVEEIIALLYRLGLSCHVLQNWHRNSNSNNIINNKMHSKDITQNVNIIKEDGNKNCNNHHVHTEEHNDNHAPKSTSSSLDLKHIASLAKIPPKIMIESLATYDFHNNNDGCTEQPEINNQVNFETLKTWIEIHFPQMACILSTFIHLILFEWNKKLFDKDEALLDESCSNNHSHHSSNDEFELINNISFIYAQGKRSMFQFPELHQLIMSKSLVHNIIKNQLVGTPPTSSVIMDSQTFHKTNSYDNVNDKGITGHFAFGLACMDAKMCGKWYRLYSTETDGFSFLNMQRALIGYTGPTVMIIRPTKASVSIIDGANTASSSPGLFGMYTSNPWKESKTFYGSSDCFLFRADPKWNVYRPKTFVQGWKKIDDSSITSEDDASESLIVSSLYKKKLYENFMYFNPSAGHVHGSQSMGGGGYAYGHGSAKSVKRQGIAIGGTIDQPRLYISESFDQCVASSGDMIDMTFENGSLLPGAWDKYFNVDVLEVWGVGGEDIVRNAIDAKEKHDDITDAVRKKVQRVDRHQFLEDFRSGLHVDNKLFQHRVDGNIRYDFETDNNSSDRCM